jgi:hypothetical protein
MLLWWGWGVREAQAQSGEIGAARPFGLGVVVGEPTGLSAKLYLSARNAVDAVLAFDTYGDRSGWVYLHATYLWHPSLITSATGVDVGWHVGVGGFVSSGRWGWYDDEGWAYDDAVGIRAPIGLDVDLTAAPVQFFGDVAVHVGVFPGTYVDLGFGIGARYYF